MAEYYGMNPPFIGGAQNVLSRQEDEQLIKNDLLQLLLTIPGERVNRPKFGTPLRSYVFEQGAKADLISLQQDVSLSIATFEKRVNKEFLQITFNEDENKLLIKLIVSIKKDPKKQLTIQTFIDSPANQ